MKKLFLSVCICILFLFGKTFSQADSLYLGLTPPGNSPVKFQLETDPGNFASDRIAITTNGKQIYYSETTGVDWSHCKVRRYTYSGGTWNGTETLYTGNIFGPGLINSDSILILENLESDNYYSSLSGGVFGTASSMAEKNHYLQQTDSRNYYTGRGGGIQLLSSGSEDSIFSDLGKPINMGGAGGFAVAKDESFIIFMSGQEGGADLYVSYRVNNRWTNPKNLGPAVNSPNHDDYGAALSNDNRYLFFSRSAQPYVTGGIYWVDIEELLDSLRITNFVPYFSNPVPNQFDNVGNEFSYTFPDSTFFDDDTDDKHTYSVKLTNGNDLPDWLDFDPDTRALSGTPLMAEYLNLEVTATDNAGAGASDKFSIKISAPVGSALNMEPETASIVIFPNPINTESVLTLKNEKPHNLEIRVFNTMGQEIITDWFTGNCYALGNKINQSGTYLVYILDGSDIIYCGKIVK